MVARGSLTLPAAGGKLFVGNGIAYVGAGGGFVTASVANPDNLQLLSGVDAANIEGSAIVANGSGLALAAVGPNSSDDGPHDVSLYALSPDGRTNQFITTFTTLTNGIATAIAIYNGQAYVAARTAGLEVINYQSYTNSGVPPTINLTASFPLQPAQALEGSERL